MYNEEKNFDFNLEPGQYKEEEIMMGDSKPLISIITAYYNSKEFIRQTANSVFNQTFPYWEWIIVDDGSTEDGTKELLNSLAKEDSRVKIFHKKNEGPAATRMYAVNKAKTELLFILDSDDLIDKTFLECGYFTMLTNSGAAWAYSKMVNFAQEEYLWDRYFTTSIEKQENVICGNSIIRKHAFMEVGGYGESKKNIHEDWQLWLKLLAKEYYPIKMNFYGFWYRRRKGSVLHTITNDKSKNKMANLAIELLAKKIKKEVKAIQFPVKTNTSELLYPNIFDLNKKPLKHNKSKKQLLFILPWFTVGGADNFNLELISKLDKDKFEITIVTTEYSKYITRQKFEPYATIFDLTTFLKQKDWAGFIHYLIKSRNIDLVFLSNSFYGYYVAPWLKSEFPDISFVDYLHAEDFSWRNGGYPRDSIAISNVLDMTYTCTKHLENIMYSKMDRITENTKTIYIGVDSERFSPDNNNIKKLDISEYKDKKIILFACRIYELKRPIFVLKVIQKLLKKRSDIVLFVVGDGPQLNEMKSMAIDFKVNESVIFFGMAKDLRPYYNVADVTLITSLTEGLTLTAYESLSMGVPVISSDVGGQSELVGNDCGKIIETFQSVEKDLFNRDYSNLEIDKYVDAIIDVIDSKKAAKLKENCRKKILDGFTIDNTVKVLTIEFEKLISNQANKKIVDKEIAKNYLALYLQTNPLYFDKNNNKWSYRTRVKEKLWGIPAWRFLIKIAHKTKLIEMKKKILKR